MAPPIIKRFLISFEQNKWLGFLILFLAIMGSTFYALQAPPPPPKPTYKAVGQLAFRIPPPAFTTTGNQLQQQGRSISQSILLSPRVLAGVQAKLKLSTEEINDILQKKLKLQLPGQEEKKTDSDSEAPSSVITLEYSEIPKSLTEADQIQAQTSARSTLAVFMEEMVDYSRWLNTSQLRARIAALTERLGQVKQNLTQAEEAFYRYISRNSSDLLAVQDGSLFSGITSSQQKQRDLKLYLQEIEGQINSLENQLGLTPDQAYTSAALSADPIIASIRARILQNELELERLKRDLRPEHPNIVKLRKDQAVNNALLQQRAQELIGRDNILTPLPSQIRKDSNLDPTRQQLASQLITLQTQREGLLKQLQSVVNTEQELRQQYERYPDKQVKQASLVQAVEFQRVLYQNILTALVDAQAAEAETVGSLTMTQEPGIVSSASTRPQRLNPYLVILGGGVVGAVAATGVIFLLALVDDRLHTPQELRDALADKEVPLLGQLPLIPGLALHEEISPILLDGDSTYLSFYERVRSNVRRLGPDSSKVIVITSVMHEEGKSISAYNLAIASAQAGKRTLLVEADLRSASLARWLDITPEPEASIEPLHYYASRSEAISLVPAIENLYILPSPGPQRQAAAIIESSELQLLLKDIRGRFDMVIIDTPSLSQCNDALLIEPLTDGIILVTRPGITRSSLLNEAIAQFSEAEVPVLGGVINGVEDLALPAFAPEKGETTLESSEQVTASNVS